MKIISRPHYLNQLTGVMNTPDIKIVTGIQNPSDDMDFGIAKQMLCQYRKNIAKYKKLRYFKCDIFMGCICGY